MDAAFLTLAEQRLKAWLDCSPPPVSSSTPTASVPIPPLSDKALGLKREFRKKIVLVTAGGTTGEEISVDMYMYIW